MGRLRLVPVVLAGLLAGAVVAGIMLALSGLHISRDPWSREMSPPSVDRPPVVRPETVPETAQQPQAVPRWLSRAHLGPVSTEIATDLVGELTLEGFTATVRVVSIDGRTLRVVSSGPYPQTTIDAIVALVRRKFPEVNITVVPVK
jgi:hypothetical protein